MTSATLTPDFADPGLFAQLRELPWIHGTPEYARMDILPPFDGAVGVVAEKLRSVGDFNHCVVQRYLAPMATSVTERISCTFTWRLRA